MPHALRGKVAIVTGAGRGIGQGIAMELARSGCRVAVNYVVEPERADATVEELRGLGADAMAVEADVSDARAVTMMVNRVTREFGALDILVNNVGGVTPRLGGFLEVTDEQWLGSLNLTFLAAVRTSRAVLPDMLAAGRGTIVNTCSVNAFLPDPGVIDYSAAKAALANFSKALSKEVGPCGIRVNTVSPGPVSTALWLGDHGVAATVAGAQGGDHDAVAKAQAAKAPTRRFTEPQEVADLVVLLASERAGNVTGSDFVIDGGLVQTL
jgi:NAD(P)-dependent dehydrogenase (short-subunit alcohol dehydrogenase family)